MDFRFFRSEPNAPIEWPQPSPTNTSEFVLVALERNDDPDAHNHTGYDLFGAYGDGALIDAWAEDQPIELITATELPSPVTFYPAPFNEA